MAIGKRFNLLPAELRILDSEFYQDCGGAAAAEGKLPYSVEEFFKAASGSDSRPYLSSTSQPTSETLFGM